MKKPLWNHTRTDLTLGCLGERRVRSQGDGTGTGLVCCGIGAAGHLGHASDRHLTALALQFDRWDRVIVVEHGGHVDDIQ
jgi:hypothetical protein